VMARRVTWGCAGALAPLLATVPICTGRTSTRSQLAGRRQAPATGLPASSQTTSPCAGLVASGALLGKCRVSCAAVAPDPAKRPPGQARGPLQAQRPGAHGRFEVGHRPGGSAPREAGFPDPNDDARERSPSNGAQPVERRTAPDGRSRRAPAGSVAPSTCSGVSIPATSGAGATSSGAEPSG
jgi:hypothetical protein